MTDQPTAKKIAEEHAPAPWHVGSRPNPRSLYPIRDAKEKVVAYAYNGSVAQLIVELRGAVPADGS